MFMDTKLNTIEILKDFHRVTGARISLHDLDYNEIASYPESLSDFCQKVQRKPKNKNRCIDADLKAFETVRKTGEAYSYKCHCGLIEIVAPIYNYGILSGYVIMGQITDSKSSSEENITVNIVDGKNMSVSIPSVLINTTENARVTYNIKMPHFLYGSIKSGEQVGSISYYCNGNFVCEKPIVSNREICYNQNKIRLFFEIFKNIFSNF